MSIIAIMTANYNYHVHFSRLFIKIEIVFIKHCTLNNKLVDQVSIDQI